MPESEPTPTVTELFEGRTETVAAKSTAEIHYMVRDAEDEAAVKTAILNGTDLYYAGLARTSIEISEHVIGEDWKVIVKYETPEPGHEEEPVIPDPQFSFDTTGGTQHITNSLETVDSAGEVSEDLGGAIGVDAGNVNGCDITVPAYGFSETHYYTDAEMAGGIKSAIFETTGKVNTDSFKGFDAGEVLFLGASGSRTGTAADDLWEVTYKFSAKKNRTGVVYGNLPAVDVDGWNYVWQQYMPDVDTGSNRLIKKPIAVYVELVYDSCAFSVLGLEEVGS